MLGMIIKENGYIGDTTVGRGGLSLRYWCQISTQLHLSLCDRWSRRPECSESRVVAGTSSSFMQLRRLHALTAATDPHSIE